MSDRAEQAKALIEKRLAAATPGPWDYFTPNPRTNPGFQVVRSLGLSDLALSDEVADAVSTRDAEFIANAPADIAFLLTALTASEAEVTRLETGIAEVIDYLETERWDDPSFDPAVKLRPLLSHSTTDTNGAHA